jgi:hypothetical protein
MLIIINDDGVYVAWLSRHRHGFVVDCKRKPTRNHLVLHRATCSIIKPHKRARLTSGAHIKACSLDAQELQSWALEQTGGNLVPCQECRPDAEEPLVHEHHGKHALTRLGREVLSYVLDLAVLYLDGEERHYQPRVEGIAAYLGKSTAQIAPVLQRLIEEGYLDCDPPATNARLAPRAIVYPTGRALRTIPAFGAMSDTDVAAELNSLKRLEGGELSHVS